MQNYLNLKNDNNPNKLIQPATVIRNGGIVVFPTETVYGIGTNGLNSKSVQKLYTIKKRPFNKPISLLVNNVDMIKQIAKDITPIEYKIIDTFFPGPLTIILKKKDIIPDIVTAGLPTVGVRIPANDTALNLINIAKVPIATSSANVSGDPSGTNISNIIDNFSNNINSIDYFIDDDKKRTGHASTIIQIINNKPYILRQGPISLEQINSIL